MESVDDAQFSYGFPRRDILPLKKSNHLLQMLRSTVPPRALVRARCVSTGACLTPLRQVTIQRPTVEKARTPVKTVIASWVIGRLMPSPQVRGSEQDRSKRSKPRQTQQRHIVRLRGAPGSQGPNALDAASTLTRLEE